MAAWLFLSRLWGRQWHINSSKANIKKGENNNALHSDEIANYIFFLCSASTATYLSAYIVDLILVLHEVSMVVLVDRDLPKDLSTDLVMDALATYKLRSSDIHTQVKEGASIFKPEEKIATVIRDSLSGSSP